MERKQPRLSTDELAMVKAAAWAWYQHGFGCEGKSMREFDLERTCRDAGPSRFKLEAMKIAERIADDGNDGSESSNSLYPVLSPTRTDNSLLDTYEIERISMQLDFLIKSSSASFHYKSFSGDRDHRRNASLWSESGGMQMRKKLNGFWQRSVVCGSMKDVVVDQTRVLAGAGRRLPKQVSVHRSVNCLPRANHPK